MIEYALVALASMLAIYLFSRFDLVASCQAVFATAAKSAAIDKDPHLPQRDKERQIQQAAKQLLGLFARILSLSVVALILPFLPLYLLSLFDWLDFAKVLEILSSVEFFVVFLLVFIVVYIKAKRV